MRGDRDSALIAHAGKQLRKRFVANLTGRRRRTNPELSETAPQFFLGETQRIEAEYVYAFGRGQLEARKHIDRPLSRGGPKWPLSHPRYVPE